MKKHLFLTGEKGSGKSTTLKKLLKEHNFKKIKGFYTLRIKNPDGFYSVHILKAGTDETPSEANLLFYCGALRSRYSEEEITARFNKLGCEALSDIDDADLIVMDELGPNEEFALDFKKLVLKLLDGDTPILGVVQKADSDFLDMVKKHPKVEVREIIRNF